MSIESKLKIGDKVKVSNCPMLPEVVGRIGVVSRVREKTFTVKFDIGMIIDADNWSFEELGVELVEESCFGDSNGVIREFMIDNGLECMHLEMYLESQGFVCITKDDYAKIKSVINEASQ